MLTTADRGAQHDGARYRVPALVSWWKLAGHDTPVNDQPHSWLQAPARASTSQQPAEPAAPITAEQSSVGPARESSAESASFANIATLDELAALIRRDHPRSPFADGNPASGVMLVGAGPSAEDFRTGKPFSGPAGQLLDAMLRAIGLDRSGCYIALAAPRWPRPTPPSADAYAADRALVQAHVQLATPRVLLLLGAGAVESLTGDKTPIGRLRGSWLAANGIPALATYNPGYLLRRPADKRHAWADLLAFQRRLAP